MSKDYKFTMLFFVILILTNCNLYSGTIFNLTVLDKDKNSVQNAEIIGGCGNGNIEGKTNEMGRFSTKVQCVFDEGFYFYVKKDGYQEYRYDMELFQYNELKEIKIILEKK